jgi:hypothetical protein
MVHIRLKLTGMIVLLCLARMARGQAAAQTPDDKPDMGKIVGDLRSEDEETRKAGVAALTDLSQNDYRFGLDVAKWAEPLLATKAYAETEQIATMAVLRRALDSTQTEMAERLRMRAIIGQGDYVRALPEAKAYYNIAALSATGEAVGYLADLLGRTADAAMAEKFRKEQAEMKVDSAATTRAGTVLAGILVDQTRYDFALQYLQGRVGAGGASFQSLMAQGNYLLLADRPDDARKEFVAACKAAGHKAKQVRDAVEGVARAIRAENGNASAANAFILSLRKMDSAATEELVGADDGKGDATNADDVRNAAMGVKLADLSQVETAGKDAKP